MPDLYKPDLYKPEAGELLIDCELPRQDVVPTITGYRYIKTHRELRPPARNDADRKQLYGRLIARVALRVIRETLDATPPALVTTVTLNGHVSAVHRATGNPIRPCLVSVMAARDDFDTLKLDAPELDPQLCLRHLNAIVSPHPYDLEAIRPVAEFDLSKYKWSFAVWWVCRGCRRVVGGPSWKAVWLWICGEGVVVRRRWRARGRDRRGFWVGAVRRATRL